MVGIPSFTVCPGNNSRGYFTDYHLSSRPWIKNAFVLAMSTHPCIQKRRWKFKRQSCPCSYYSNSEATFRPLIGDLVFKLNPGPENKASTSGPLSNINRRSQVTSSVHNQRKHPMVLCLLNARSVKNKIADIIDYINDCKADLCAITETWLCPDDAAIRAELCPNGYKLFDHPRVGRRGGGTGLIFRDSLSVKQVDAGEKTSFEFSEWIVLLPPHNLRIVALYRPPQSAEHKVSTSTFFTEFSCYLESIILAKEQLIILGDFNIHVDIMDDPDSLRLLDLLDSVGLRQHINQSTHIHGHTLDLIITRSSENILKGPPCVDRYLSDHGSIICQLCPFKPAVTIKSIHSRKLKSINMDSLKNDVAASTLCTDQSALRDHLTAEELDLLVRGYQDTLTKVIDHHAPTKTKTIVARATVPWFNEEIDLAKRLRRKAERTWRRTKSSSDLKIFKAKRNHVTYLLNKAKRAFYTEFVNENSNDQGKLFKAAKKLLSKNEELSFPEYQDKGKLVNDIGRFFISKIDSIRSDIEACNVNSNTVLRDLAVDDAHSLNTFQLLSDSEVLDLIQKSAKKTCSLDPMPTPLVVCCTDLLLPAIKSMINSSLSIGYFPADWKQALVSPLLKKEGLDKDFKNLRPVSNLQFVSKLTERAVFDQLQKHLMRFDLYPVLQSAYRKGFSTETALLKVQNDLLMNMNRQQVTLLVLLDLSAAFDTVDHEILLSRLKVSFGIRGTALDWFSSYLSNRHQRINFNGHLSENFQLHYGIPQGSCLGPLLFTIYSSKLFQIIKNHLPDVHAYADDTQLYLAFSPDNTVGQSQAITAMERCVEDIRTWMLTDKLKINDKKTEFMIIGTRQQLSKISPCHLTVGNTNVTSVNSARNLGTWFDCNLNLQEHINKTCRAAYYHMHNIRHIRKFLTKETTQTLVHAFVIGRIDYCNSLLYNLPAVHLAKLQRLQNSAARLICYTPRFMHITPVLCSLHWLPVKYRILFKVIILTFKVLHGISPNYLKELITIKERSKYNLRSNNGLLLEMPSIKTKKTLGDRSFTVAAPTLWNNLPLALRNETNFSKFKSSLKTHFFRIAYY